MIGSVKHDFVFSKATVHIFSSEKVKWESLRVNLQKLANFLIIKTNLPSYFSHFISSFTLLSWAWASQWRQPLHMAETSPCEVLLAGHISTGVDIMPFRSLKDSYSLFPVDGVLIQWRYYANLFYRAWKIICICWNWTRVPAVNNLQCYTLPLSYKKYKIYTINDLTMYNLYEFTRYDEAWIYKVKREHK